MTGQRCDDCRFWLRIEPSPEPGVSSGYCRRSPPTIVAEVVRPGIEQDGSFEDMTDVHVRYATRFPIVDDGEWCGKWRQPLAGARALGASQ